MLALVRLLGTRRAGQVARSAGASSPDAPRILIIRPDHLGDLVLTTPVLHALKQQLPNAQLTMAVGPWSSEIVARHPDIHRLLVLAFPGYTRAPQKPFAPYILLWSVAKQLQRGHFDLAINLRSDFWWGAALLYLAGIPRRVGYALHPGTPFYTHALPFNTHEHATISSLRLASASLQALGHAPLPEPFTPQHYPLAFKPQQEEQEQVRVLLMREGIDGTIPLVVIHPGTGAAVKLWRGDGWAYCADRVAAHLTSAAPARIILTGSKHERPLLEEIALKLQGIQGMLVAPLLLTTLTIGQLAALMERATLVLGVDNGPLHIAVAQGTPTLHLFGPTDPRVFGPWGSTDRHRVLASTHRCPACPAIPCGRLDIPPRALPAHACTRKISEQQVWAVIQDILAAQKDVD